MRKLLLILGILTQSVGVHAQYERHNMPAGKEKEPPPKTMQHEMPEQDDDTTGADEDDMEGMDKHKGHTNMTHAFSLNLPMNRNGSGTGWLPDNSPMYGKMIHARKWMYMIHGNIFLRYNKQDVFDKGARGGEKFDAPNWIMAMGQRKVGRKGLFHFSTMLSLDAAIAGGSGYPLLFQSGETWQGKPLVDRQHPHDLFSELSVSYSHAFNRKMDVFVYVGYPGEPALGSVAFMHRPSAMTNPDAPISHHWNDGTHITFGVATLGFRYNKLKLEASSFTGREPNENRWGFDKPSFDSWSGRISYNPTSNLAFQLSQGYIKSPESTHPGDDVNRTTASAIYSYNLSRNKLFNATALWGLNKVAGHAGENAALIEASLAINRFNVYGRYEWVQKSVEELNLDETVYGLETLFPVNALTLGANYDILKVGVLRIAGGAQASLYAADAKLDKLYGKNPMAGQVYVRVYPNIMRN